MGVAELLAAGAAGAAVSTPPAADEHVGEHAGERAPGPAAAERAQAADRARAAGDQTPAPEQHAA
ncbi:hypothetical protein GCM10009802_58860 [Streptomyces synnematoformans]|uniref:Uncharacterized protein n=1 Tax=Streptomyces synnematoformans TaxID=415721 RepID=A0ABP4KGF6_9ACTN